MSVIQQPISSPISTPTNYERVIIPGSNQHATYEGMPVIYNRITDDLAYEGLQEGLILTLPANAEILLRNQLDLPRTGHRHRIDCPGIFVALISSVSSLLTESASKRRGLVLCSDDRGLTLRVVSIDGLGLAAAYTEMWPWTSIDCLAAAKPDQQERALLHKIIAP